MILNESHIRKIVESSLKNYISEEIMNTQGWDPESIENLKDREGDVRGTYYTITSYVNNKRSWCIAFKKLKKAEAALREDYKEEVEQFRLHKRYSGETQVSKIEWIDADTYMSDEEIAQLDGQAPDSSNKKRGKGKPVSMNNAGFEVTYKDGTVVAEYMAEEEGNISALDRIDRFSDNS